MSVVTEHPPLVHGTNHKSNRRLSFATQFEGTTTSVGLSSNDITHVLRCTSLSLRMCAQFPITIRNVVHMP